MADQRHGAPHGEGFLEAITEAMVAIHERYHGRKPGNAHTILMGDDIVACMLGDVYTDVEKTMIELQRQALVHETRSAFQKAMEHRFIAAVERLTGRAVARFLSTHHVAPTSSSSSSSLSRDPRLRRRRRGNVFVRRAGARGFCREGTSSCD